MEKYKKIAEQNLPEVNCKATIYEHIKTGARVCTLDTEDINKVFCIAFKTPAINSTGVTHIIEHSVLCGSKKYPVKDPFVELMKGSLNTFLNAFTFPDKTMYPCASKNDKDFKNLMDIYLNAVFFPRIYTCKNIFLQEGWHYEIFNKDDPIKYNGVVYNEMKGAYSSADEVLNEVLMNGTFDGTTYQYESGGDPECIPNLTYEDFIGFHKKYYSPTNSYIFLYGKMDMEERMDFLDKEYLSKFEKIDVNPIIKKSESQEKLVEKEIFYPIAQNEILDNKTNLGLGIALTGATDIKDDIAFTILDRILINSPSGIIKNKLLAAGIGDDIEGGCNDGINEVAFSIISKNTSMKQKDNFLNVINDTLNSLANGELDHESVLAYINNFEFKARENLFGRMPLGLEIILKSMDTWLYDDKTPFLKLNQLGYYKELREDLKNGYFEELIKKYLLNNNHKFLVIQKPSNTLQIEKEKAAAFKLEKYKATLSSEEIASLIRMNEELREYQSAPDSIESINSIPHLTLQDLKMKPDNYPCNVEHLNFDLYTSNYFTNGIVYGDFYFNAKDISYKHASELALLSALLTKLPTNKHTNQELDKMIGLNCGSFDATLFLNKIYKTNDYNFYFGFEFSVLKENLGFIKDMSLEFINDSQISNEAKLQEIIGSEKARLDQAVNYGHSLAMIRSKRNNSVGDYLNDEINGVGYIDFINDLSKNFATKKDELIKDLSMLIHTLFTKENFVAYSTLDKETMPNYKEACMQLYENLPSSSERKVNNEQIKLKPINEGFMCPFDVNFVIRSCDFARVGCSYNGKMDVLTNAIGIDYLWQNVRVKGGAYGAGLLLNQKMGFALYSYRDPHIVETNNIYFGIPEFIKSMKYSDEELLKLKIGSISNNSYVMHPSDAGKLGFSRLLSGYTYEEVVKQNDELLECTVSDLNNFANTISELLNNSNLCVIGNEKQVDDNKKLFNEIRKLY
ncbi:MAG: insulinase family protein [Bacilli bacterium]